MPSRSDPKEPQDPMEDDDLIGAEDAADEADDAEDDGDVRDEDDDELDEDEEDEVVDPDEEIATQGSREPTDEVGSEGGSPGDTVERTRARGGLGRGSEATTTWERGLDATHELRDEHDVPAKRTP